MLEWSILICAAFGAGVFNSIAGGGSFLTFPALVYVGIPPVAANATSAVAVFPGYLGGAVGFRAELSSINRYRLFKYGVVSFAGGAVGSLLLLVTSNALFSFIVPWLLLFATLVFATGDILLKKLSSLTETLHRYDLLFLFVISVYGGYFNGGLGIILLALLLLVGFDDLNVMNGLKNGMSFVISCVSVSIFSYAGLVHWSEASVMMVVSTCGGYCGAILAKRISKSVLKCCITGVGLIMAAIFFFQLLSNLA